MIKKHIKNISLIKPSAVLFDTDNTLYEYYPAKVAAEDATCKKAKNLIGINRDTFLTYYEKARKEIKQNLAGTASGHSRLLYFQRMIELLGFKAELLLALDLEQTFWRTFLANAPLFPDVRKTLNLLKNKNIPIGVVTDLTSHIQLRKLTYFGLEDTFDAVVTSEEIGKDKPDKRNFLLLLKKLKIKKQDPFWMVGDDPNSDIFGAKQLGAVTFQKVHSKVKVGTGENTPNFSFSSYSDLIDIINKTIE